MSEIKRKLDELNASINEIAADQALFRVTLQRFLLRMTDETDPEFVASMKRQVLGSLAQTRQNSPDRQGAERMKQLTMLRAERFFQELEAALPNGQRTSPADPSKLS